MKIKNYYSPNFDRKKRRINSIKIIESFLEKIKLTENFQKETLETIINDLIKSFDTNFKGIGQPLRICLTGSKFGPGIYDILSALGKDEVIKRLNQIW